MAARLACGDCSSRASSPGRTHGWIDVAGWNHAIRTRTHGFGCTSAARIRWRLLPRGGGRLRRHRAGCFFAGYRERNGGRLRSADCADRDGCGHPWRRSVRGSRPAWRLASASLSDGDHAISITCRAERRNCCRVNRGPDWHGGRGGHCRHACCPRALGACSYGDPVGDRHYTFGGRTWLPVVHRDSLLSGDADDCGQKCGRNRGLHDETLRLNRFLACG